MELLGHSGRIHHGIRDAIIHRIEAGGLLHPDHGELKGGRFPGEHQHSGTGGVADEIDYDVDAGLPQRLCKRLVRQGGGVNPLVAISTQARRDIVTPSVGEHPKDLELGVIVVLKHRLHKVRDRVRPKIG